MAQEDISPRASLAVIGQRFQQMGIWLVVEQSVHVKQKVLRHKPSDKLKDCLINILAGGSGLVETNLRVRPVTELSRWHLDGHLVQSSLPSAIR